MIIEKIEMFERTASGKSWQNKPYKTRTEEVDEQYYNNVVSSIGWFNSGIYGQTCRGYKTYTCHGYVYYKIVSVSPGRRVKEVRTYTFS